MNKLIHTVRKKIHCYIIPKDESLEKLSLNDSADIASLLADIGCSLLSTCKKIENKNK